MTQEVVEQGLEIQIFLTPKLGFLPTLQFNLKCTVGSTKHSIRTGIDPKVTAQFHVGGDSAELAYMQESSWSASGMTSQRQHQQREKPFLALNNQQRYL